MKYGFQLEYGSPEHIKYLKNQIIYYTRNDDMARVVRLEGMLEEIEADNKRYTLEKSMGRALELGRQLQQERNQMTS